MRCYEPKVQFVCCTCLLRSPKTVTVERREDSAHAEPLVFVAWTTYIYGSSLSFISVVSVCLCLAASTIKTKSRIQPNENNGHMQTPINNKLFSIKSLAW